MSEHMDEEVKLTAFALGELPAEEAQAFAAKVKADPELARLVEELRATAGALESAFEQEAAPALDEARRAQILATPTVVALPRRRWVPVAMIGAVAAGLLVTLTLPNLLLLQPSRTPELAQTPQLREKKAELPPPPPKPLEGLLRGMAEKRGVPIRTAPGNLAGRLLNPDVPSGTAAGLGHRLEVRELPAGEEYSPIQSAGLTETAVEPRTTFAIDVDTASYSNVRRYLDQGRLPPVSAVRVEEMINYFDYDLPPPNDGTPIAIHVDVTDAPWDGTHLVARVALKGKQVSREARPPAHLVFLIDVSGSMSAPNRLPLVKQSLRLLLEQLRPSDTVAIVTYASGTALRLPPTPVREAAKIRKIVEGLGAGGATNGSGGIQLAYRAARDGFQKGAINRVILATDGDFNVGIRDRAELERMIAAEAGSGVFLTVLGYGMGNLNDATLETLADKGNGHYAYIDRLEEAQKVLVEEVSGTLVTIAKDVKVQLEFNPARIQAYRLVGYENRRLANQDFSDDKKDGGEMGAGHAVTMLYELVPKQGEASGEDALRYQAPRTSSADTDEMFFVRVRYKDPEGDKSALVERAVRQSSGHFAGGAEDLRFATAVAAFGMMLRQAPATAGLSFETVAAWVDHARKHDPGGRRGELAGLIRRAGQLAQSMGPLLSPGRYGVEVLKPHIEELAACAKVAEPSLKGQVFHLRFMVSEEGKAGPLTIYPALAQGTLLERCVQSMVARWEFPRFSGPPQEVKFVVDLSQEADRR